MESNTDQSLHYIRKNRVNEAIIYLKDNEQKIAQKLFCYMYAWDNEYKIVRETTNLDEVKNCDLVLVASADILLGDIDEHSKIEKELKRKGIQLEIAINETNEEEYMERALDLFRKGF